MRIASLMPADFFSTEGTSVAVGGPAIRKLSIYLPLSDGPIVNHIRLPSLRCPAATAGDAEGDFAPAAFPPPPRESMIAREDSAASAGSERESSLLRPEVATAAGSPGFVNSGQTLGCFANFQLALYSTNYYIGTDDVRIRSNSFGRGIGLPIYVSSSENILIHLMLTFIFVPIRRAAVKNDFAA